MKNLGLVLLVIASVFIGLAFLSKMPGEYEDFIKGMSFDEGRNKEMVRLGDKRESQFLTCGLIGLAFATIGAVLIAASNEKKS